MIDLTENQSKHHEIELQLLKKIQKIVKMNSKIRIHWYLKSKFNEVLSFSRAPLQSQRGDRVAGQKKALDRVLPSTYRHSHPLVSFKVDTASLCYVLLMNPHTAEWVYLSVHIWHWACASTRLEGTSERATLHSSSSMSKAVIDMVNASATGGHC